MRKPDEFIEAYRIKRLSKPEWGMNGAFAVPYRDVVLCVICSDGLGWDHVSVSLPDRCPTWDEMNHIKDLFFCSDECVVQYHPPKKDYVNNHPYVLHLWRPQEGQIPRPPKEMVGVMGASQDEIRNLSEAKRAELFRTAAGKVAEGKP